MINDFTSRSWLQALLELFFPRFCLVCGNKLPLDERHICSHCLKDLPRTYYSKMSRNRMADRLNAFIQRDLDVGQSLRGDAPVPYSYATALFFYRAGTGYRDITKHLKYHGDLSAGRYFSEMLADELVSSDLYSDVDVVIPVPLHWTRRWSRGFNQAEVIASVLARRLGASLREDVLSRRRKTKTQTRLSLEGKAANVAGAFMVNKGVKLTGCSHVLIVDDVFTTGSTVHECYKALRSLCPPNTRISVATLACVGD